MLLRDLFTSSAVELHLAASSREEALAELVNLLDLGPHVHATLVRTLRRREHLGSTGIGKGVAIPHCRSDAVDKLLVAYGRKPGGLEFAAIDGAPVRHFFLIVAPPAEVSNDYLKVLAQVARFAKDADVPALLGELQEPQEFVTLLEHSQ